MTCSINALFADEVIDCVSENRNPTVEEVTSVARRIWSDGASGRSAFSWDRLPETSLERLASLRAAHFALLGDP